MKLYNTLDRRLEEFTPIEEKKVRVYSCGPTVYWNQHIGNMYAFLCWDLLVRSLRYLDYQVKWVMNITDVGHKVSDEDEGEDKMEKGAKREGVTVWQIADKYIEQFRDSMSKLGVINPDVLCRATDHIDEQIELIKKIEANGYTYRTKTGLVFDTGKFADYAKFAKLALDKQEAGARVEIDEEKKNPWDFLLWVTNQPEHIMKWDSPWGVGFPGWHIECTAMSVKYLGELFDIHTGGKEHIPVHHTNEIAQGYGAFGHQTANYWLHNEWLTLKEGKMSKSLGNVYTVQDLEKMGYDPLAFRYLVMTSGYRQGLVFSLESLDASQTAFRKMRKQVLGLGDVEEIGERGEEYRERFKQFLNDDLNIAGALALVWDVLKSELSSGEKKALILDFDRVLGLDLGKGEVAEIADGVSELVEQREEARKNRDWAKADEIRGKIEDLGYRLLDTAEGVRVEKK